VLVVGHADRPEAADLAQSAEAWLGERGYEVVATPDDRERLGLTTAVEWPSDPRSDGDVHDGLVLALSIGGDGTMLRTVTLVGESETPVLGVNVGLLGYLTAVEPPAMIRALSDFFDERLERESRFVLDVTSYSSAGEHRYRALNEASLEKLTAGHTVRLQVSIDDVPFTTYQADGMIVATPTGSTAYSLSARGPIVSPRMRAILLTPLSPHMLFDRSLVLASNEVVELDVTGTRPVGLAVDGEYMGVLRPGDRIVCRESKHPATFVKANGQSFHRVLKSKFGLSDR
jgi:NAD+ kinase